MAAGCRSPNCDGVPHRRFLTSLLSAVADTSMGVTTGAGLQGLKDTLQTNEPREM